MPDRCTVCSAPLVNGVCSFLLGVEGSLNDLGKMYPFASLKALHRGASRVLLEIARERVTHALDREPE